MTATTSMTWTDHSVAAQSLVDQAQHCLLQVIGLTDDLRIELGALSGLARATARQATIDDDRWRELAGHASEQRQAAVDLRCLLAEIRTAVTQAGAHLLSFEPEAIPDQTVGRRMFVLSRAVLGADGAVRLAQPATDRLLSTLVDAESAFLARDRQGLRQHARKLGARSSALNGVLQLLPAALNVPDTSVDRASLLIQTQLGLADH